MPTPCCLRPSSCARCPASMRDRSRSGHRPRDRLATPSRGASSESPGGRRSSSSASSTSARAPSTSPPVEPARARPPGTRGPAPARRTIARARGTSVVSTTSAADRGLRASVQQHVASVGLGEHRQLIAQAPTPLRVVLQRPALRSRARSSHAPRSYRVHIVCIRAQSPARARSAPLREVGAGLVVPLSLGRTFREPHVVAEVHVRGCGEAGRRAIERDPQAFAGILDPSRHVTEVDPGLTAHLERNGEIVLGPELLDHGKCLLALRECLGAVPGQAEAGEHARQDERELAPGRSALEDPRGLVDELELPGVLARAPTPTATATREPRPRPRRFRPLAPRRRACRRRRPT